MDWIGIAKERSEWKKPAYFEPGPILEFKAEDKS
jgi:hypothetical protein